MTRVKKAVHALKRRRSRLARTKGFRHGRSTKERQASEAIAHAGASAFAHRRDKKGDARNLWVIRINAALDKEGVSYSKFIGALKKNGVALDRKILSTLANDLPETFKKIIAIAK